MSKQDADQVQKVLAGDQAAYEPLVEAYQGRIFAFVAGRIRDLSATEDIVQNAFVEAYMHLKSLKSPEKFAGWLRGIALNLSNKWLQQKRPIISIDDTSRDITPEVSEFPLPDLPDEVLEKSQTKETVLTAVDALPHIYRESVLLHYMEGMTYPEIAAFLDIPESTVTGRLQVARNRLRDELMPLVEDTLREKRPTPQLTRKIMAALPPLLYAAAPAQASLLAKLKGTGMIKIMGIKVIQSVEKKRISRPAPTYEVQKLDGEKITLADLKGKAVVVTFWAGWCSPCIEELPYLQNLKEQFRKQNVEFLAVNIDQDSPTRRDMVASFRYQSAPLLTFALGDVEIRKAFGSAEIPYTCIIDQNGQIRYERKGLGADFSVAMAHQLQWVTGIK